MSEQKAEYKDDATAMPFVRIDDVIIYLHCYDGFMTKHWDESSGFNIQGRQGGQWHDLGLYYGDSPLCGGYDHKNAKVKAQAAIDAIQAALEKWNNDLRRKV